MPLRSPSPRYLLIVDDLPAIRRPLALVLAGHGYAVREAGTLAGADALLPKAAAVITDGTFPAAPGEPIGPWGLVLAERAQARGVPVLLVTGDAMLAAQAAACGVTAFPKPCRAALLLEALRARVGNALP